jgi:hypothetical protein
VKPKRLLAFDALDRSLKSASELATEGEQAYAPLTETLWWIDYLNESFRAQDAGYKDMVFEVREGRVINALRYARNRHTHNRNLKSMHWPDQGFGNDQGRWRWRHLGDIQEDEIPDRQGEADYIELLQGQDVFEAFELAREFLLAWYDSLDYKGDD